MRIFVDMDGVVVDFDRYMADHKLTPRQVKDRPGAYLEMEPIPGALDALRQLIADGFEVWLATKPPTGIPWAYADKVSWVMRHIPELQTRVILTHDKGLLGSVCDILVDDRPWRANCEAFPGTLLQFGASGFDWPRVIQFVRMRRETAERATSHYATPLETPADILAAGLLVERYMGMTHQGHWVLGGIQKLDSAGGARIAHNRRGATWMQVNARYVDTAHLDIPYGAMLAAAPQQPAASSGEAVGSDDRRERLLERRTALNNSFGNGAYEDGSVQQQIDAIDEELAALAAQQQGDKA